MILNEIKNPEIVGNAIIELLETVKPLSGYHNQAKRKHTDLLKGKPIVQRQILDLLRQLLPDVDFINTDIELTDIWRIQYNDEPVKKESLDIYSECATVRTVLTMLVVALQELLVVKDLLRVKFTLMRRDLMKVGWKHKVFQRIEELPDLDIRFMESNSDNSVTIILQK